ncbi:MAG: c-type cytochrome biogenesis protein CcsB [Candidatus Melainabacteria bacterium]|nr:MAG: c-type cytochrome biogenesis protein CcsB [Candidatus Melainabacteria bacterium]
MSEMQMALTNTAGITSVMSFWVFAASNGFKQRKDLMVKIGSGAMVLAFVSLTAAIIIRGIDAQRFPLANLYESLLWFAWATMGSYLVLAKAYGVRQLGWLASLTALLMFLYGSWLPQSQHDIQPLVPALVSYWRWIHVPPLIVSYALFFLGGLAGFIQLYMAGRIQSLITAIVTVCLALLAVVLGTFTTVDTAWLQILFAGASLVGSVISFKLLQRVDKKIGDAKLAEIYDDVSYRCIAIGMPALTFGIITGGLWANHAWGTYWSWDPKESMALVTWLSYAAYIHLRVHRECSAERLALVSIVGLLLTLMTYLGFNSLGLGGLHSYGKFK